MNYADYVKSQVSEKDWKILQGMNVNLDSQALVEMWPDFVDAKKRWRTELPFLMGALAEYYDDGFLDGVTRDVPTVLDAAAGTGATTIGLKLMGINVFPNEMDSSYHQAIHREARRYGVIDDARGKALCLRSYAWNELHKDPFQPQYGYHAILCLGNSMTEAFRKEDRLEALANFNRLLMPMGKLIIDERNYPEILRGNFKHSRDVVYCGRKVNARPVHISESMVVMEYHHRLRDSVAHIPLYPFKEGELESELREAGFEEIEKFADYDLKVSSSVALPNDAEFYTYICRK